MRAKNLISGEASGTNRVVKQPAGASRSGLGNRAVDPVWAWSEYQPTGDRPWDWPLAAHLYRRAAWGAGWETLERAVADGPRAAIDRLLRPVGDPAAWERSLEEDEDGVARVSGIESLRGWWLRRMLETPDPLREKMTLFWHSHFGIRPQSGATSAMMVRYVRTLRAHALGSYRGMLEQVCQEPAVFLAWGGQSNRRMQPNERIPRHLFEHLTLGSGRYDEEDVREAARAFTGWFVLAGNLRFLDHEHDPGTKRILGRQGPWGADDVVQILLDTPHARQLVARRLYRWFVSEVDEPSGELIEPVAARLGETCELGPAVEMILRSNLFFSDLAYRRRVKSPVEYALGILVGLGTRMIPTSPLGEALARLGQDLYAPPTRRGWMGGEAWIDPATMLGRENLAAALLAPKGPLGGRLEPHRVVDARDGAAAADVLARLLLQDDLPPSARAALRESGAQDEAKDPAELARGIAFRVVTLPEFHLC